jgi:hypothetical protein
METAYAVLDESDALEDYKMQLLAEDPIAFAASKSDPDTLHFNDAMNADDLAKFKKAMLEEVNAHTEQKPTEPNLLTNRGDLANRATHRANFADGLAD